jgi:signal transduction histidine kinase
VCSSDLAEVVALHEGLARQRGVELRIAAGDSGVLRCDPRKLKQVLVNLLQNAIDATPPGGEVSIAIRAESGAGARVITVDDTGTGLAAEVRERLFQPGVTSKKGGSGLGLTIARAITEQHGGTLTLADRTEGGCRATLTIPVEPRTSKSGTKEEP